MVLIGLSIVGYVFLKDIYSIQRTVLAISPILVIFGVVILKWILPKLRWNFKYPLLILLLITFCLTTGLVSQLVNYNQYTGIFQEPGDKIYDARYISNDLSKSIRGLNLDTTRSIFVNQPYTRHFLISQILINPYKVYPVTQIQSKSCPYYIVSTVFGKDQGHFRYPPDYVKLLIDRDDLRVWECLEKR